MSYGFLFPAALLALPLALGVLIYAYLRRGNARPVMVASIFILEQLRNKIFARKKFMPPLRFFFELLLLLLLLAGLAGLFRETSGRRYALLIDNSFSMAARVSELGSAPLPLLEHARENAGQFLGGLADSERVELFTSSPALKSLSSGLVSPSAAAALLSRIKLAFANDNLEQSLRRLSGKGDYQELVVLSDRHASLASASASKMPQVSFRSLVGAQQGAKRGNLALSGVAWRQSENREEQLLVVQVHSYSAHQIKGVLVVEGLKIDAGLIRAETVARRNVLLKARSDERFSFSDLPAQTNLFRVRLEFPKTPDLAQENLILEDDQAWIARDLRVAQALLIGDLNPQQLGLNAISGIKFSWLKPEEYRPESAKEGSLLLFHRFVPSSLDVNSLPPANTLFVMPERANALFSLGGRKDDSQLTSWTDSHTLLSYINPATLRLRQAQVLQAKLPATELLRSREGSVALAFEAGGRRHVVLGLEIFPFEGRNSASLSILTLNAFKWLLDLGTSSGYLHVNSSITNPVSGSAAQASLVRYFDSTFAEYNSAQIELSPESAKFSLPYPGLAQIGNNDKASETLALNYFDPSESDLSSTTPIYLSSALNLSDSSKQREVLTRALAASLLLLILLEFVWLAARVIRQGKVAV